MAPFSRGIRAYLADGCLLCPTCGRNGDGVGLTEQELFEAAPDSEVTCDLCGEPVLEAPTDDVLNRAILEVDADE